MRNALAFYADKNNWGEDGECYRHYGHAPIWSEADFPIIGPKLDFGETAREALNNQSPPP